MLAARHCPSSLDAFEDHDSIYRILQAAPIRILIVGPPGSGKSTLATLMVQHVFGDTSNENILRVNGIDHSLGYFRTEVYVFCTTVSTHPTRQKIMLVDDLDQINEQGQHILISHEQVGLIATGNNMHQIIDVVHSRLLQVKLPAFTDERLRRILREMLAKEGLSLDPVVQDRLIEGANHSYLRMVNTLNKMVLMEDLGLGALSRDGIADLMEAVLAKDLSKGISIISDMFAEGLSVMDILDRFFEELKFSPLAQLLKFKWTKICCKYIMIYHQMHEHPLELLFFVADLIEAQP